MADPTCENLYHKQRMQDIASERLGGGRVVENNLTALAFASLIGYLPAVQVILSESLEDLNSVTTILDYNLECRRRDGWTPLCFALSQGHDKVASRLLDAGAEPREDALRLAIDNNCLESVRKLLLLLSPRSRRFNPTMAILNNNEEMANLLLEANADVNYDHDGLSSLLHAACIIGNANLVSRLISLGANVNAKDLLGQTPLQYCIQEGHKDIARLLREQSE